MNEVNALYRSQSSLKRVLVSVRRRPLRRRISLRSQSSLKRVLVSVYTERMAQRSYNIRSQSSLKRVLVSVTLVARLYSTRSGRGRNPL